MPSKKKTGPGSRTLGFAKPKAALDKARSVLSRARKDGGDLGRIEAAESAVELATKNLELAHLNHFERLVSMRTVTTCRALEEIVKLVSQRRYPVEQRHSDVIQDAILQSFTALRTALAAAIDRKRQPTRRAIAFGTPATNGNADSMEKTPLEKAIELAQDGR